MGPHALAMDAGRAAGHGGHAHRGLAHSLSTAGAQCRAVGHGTSLGLYFTPQVVEHIGNNAGPIIAGMLFALGLSFIGTAILRRYTDADFKTAWFSSAIGGASEMANLAERYGARIDRVATAHSVRVLLVVVTVPFIFQGWGVAGLDPTVPGPRVVHWPGLAALVALTCMGGLLFMRLRLQSLGAGIDVGGDDADPVRHRIVGAARLCAEDRAAVHWLVPGDRYRPDFFRAAPRFIAAVAVFTLVALALAFGLGALLSLWSAAPVPTLILGTTPGGIAEMAITAKVLQLGVPVVTAFHVTRMVFVVLVTGPMYNFLARRQRDSA